MIKLPPSNINNQLPGVFRNTTNSYKFFWYLSLIERIRDTEDLRIPVREVAAGMVTKAWYPVNFFKLSFGTQDKLEKAVRQIQENLKLNAGEREHKLFPLISGAMDEPGIAKQLDSIIRYVPYRFIRPWFSGELKGVDDWLINEKIEHLTAVRFSDRAEAPIYKFSGEELFLNLEWVFYIKQNFKILQDFGLMQLLEFLQKRNPNVPNIISKLIPPESRNLTNPRKYWREFLQHVPTFTCIYSQTPVGPEKFDLDHFLPWSYVGHDQLWNLIPAEKSANASKSDQLPIPERHFPQFSAIQKQFFDFQFVHHPKSNFLEDYTLSFRDSLANIHAMPDVIFSEKLSKIILPQWEIAKNMGFQPLPPLT